MKAEKMSLQQKKIHRDRSLVTLLAARDDPSGVRRPAQIPQLDTPPQA